jgi:hypothetical protein
MNSSSARQSFVKKAILFSVIIGAVIALFVPVFFPSIVAHSQPIDPCSTSQGIGGCLPGVDTVNAGNAKTGVTKVILDIAYFLIYLSGALAVLFIVIGAVQMITSGGDSGGYKKGIETLKNAVIGLVLAILSLTIVSLIAGFVPNSNVLSGSGGNSAYSTSGATSGFTPNRSGVVTGGSGNSGGSGGSTAISNCLRYGGGSACGSDYQTCVQNGGGNTCSNLNGGPNDAYSRDRTLCLEAGGQFVNGVGCTPRQ